MLTECTETCPPNFIRSDDACKFPRCEGVVEYSVELGGDYNQPTDDQTEMSNIYHNLELGAYPTFSNGVCKYTEATRTERIKLPDTQPACFMADNTPFLLGGDKNNLDKHSFEPRVIYDHDTPSNVTVKKSLGNECDRDCEVFENAPAHVFTNTFTNDPPPYTHRTTERYTIERIKHEATGKGKPCNASGGFVVKGNVLKSSAPPEFARYLPNTQSAPFTLLDTESYLLKKHKFMTRPEKSECGLKSDKKTIGTSEYVTRKRNDPQGKDCTKKIRIEHTYPPGKMRVIHTPDGWYKRFPCSGRDPISWSNTSPLKDCLPCDKEPTKYRLDSGAELNEFEYDRKKSSTIGQFNVTEIKRDIIPTDGTKCLRSTESGPPNRISGQRPTPECNRWMVKNPRGFNVPLPDVTLPEGVDVTSFSAVEGYVTRLPISCATPPTPQEYSIHCAQDQYYTNCTLADKNHPVYGSNCQFEEDDGTIITITPPQCPTLLNQQPCNNALLKCVDGTCVDDTCKECGSPRDCEQYDGKDVCGTDNQCYYECDPTTNDLTTNDLTTGTNDTCTGRTVDRTYSDQGSAVGTSVVRNTAPYCSPIGWCTDCLLSDKTQCENQLYITGCSDSVCSYGRDYVD